MDKSSHRSGTRRDPDIGRLVPSDMFLKIEGIEGESRQNFHNNEIDVLQFEVGAAQRGSAGTGGGLGTGKVEFQDITVGMLVSKASPALMLACATGKHFPRMTLTCAKAGGLQQDYLIIRLTDALVSSYDLIVHDNDPLPVEKVTLNFAEIDMEYRTQKNDGTLDKTFAAGFNLKTGVKK